MIVQATSRRSRLTREQKAKFLGLLPLIVRQAEVAFQGKDPQSREELTAEVVANAYVCFVRLAQLGRESLAYGTPLRAFAVKQAKAGRKVGTKSNANDVSSPYAQVAKDIRLKRLDHRDKETGEWKEILLEDRRAGPAETAAARIDFGEWLRRLPRRRRRIAEVLATGESTKRVARRFRVSPGRVSQIRRELKRCWDDFQGQGREALAVA